MKTLLPFLLILFVSLTAFSQDTESKNIPVTTNSEQALVLFNEGMDALGKVLLVTASEKFTQASELDHNFIMPRVMMAIGYLRNNDIENFKLQASKALESRASLNSSEKLMQQALKALVENPQADVTQYGKKLVDLHPESILAYQLLADFQSFAKDYEGAIKTYQSTLSLTRKPGPIYNAMGYTYMALNQMDKAKDAFEKYLKAAPDNANAYDSMGDYYAKVENFTDAQTSYMKAYEMDSANFKTSQQKAEKVKEQVAEK